MSRPVFRQYAADLQLSLCELASATVRKSVTLTMTLSDEILRRVLSLVTAPSPPTRCARRDDSLDTIATLVTLLVVPVLYTFFVDTLGVKPG